jgi:hypothetical protein
MTRISNSVSDGSDLGWSDAAKNEITIRAAILEPGTYPM